MVIEISILIGIVGLAVSILTFFIGRTTAARNGGVKDGEMKADIKHIKTSIDKQEIKLDTMIKDYDDAILEIEKLKGRLSALEQKVRLLHNEQISQ